MFKFTIKDIVFAAIIAVAMNVASFLTVPLVTAFPIPGIRSLVVAPFFGLLMAIAMLKIQKIGTATIISFLVGVLLVFISPSILAFMLASGIVADIAGYIWKGAYKNPTAVMVICGIYMIVEVWFGIIFGALFLVQGFSLDVFIQQPIAVLAVSGITFILGIVGAALGTRIGGEFKKAGVAQ